jgi:hypothetical protein
LNKQENILICPLEWGLGHAGRMIALAAKLREMNFNILFGAGEKHLSFIRNEMPGLTYISFPGFRPGYSRSLPQYFVILLRIPLLLYHILHEHIMLRKIIARYAIDIVISDNRFGLWNKNIKTVYITHQLLIPLPKFFSGLEFIGVIFHRYIIEKYTLCFIPDLPGDVNVSGRLSHGVKLPRNVRYIGILSRFTGLTTQGNESPVSFRHNTVILSGPEPQRSILEKKLTSILKNRELPSVILGACPDKPSEIIHPGKIISYNNLPGPAMKETIIRSEAIAARSGYTTIMELISLNCSALLIPTPGQTEQEYLALYLAEKGWFSTVSQRDIDAVTPLPGKDPIWNGGITEQSRILLGKALIEMSEQDQEKRSSAGTQKKTCPDFPGSV